MWDFLALVEFTFNSWKAKQWRSINVEEMIDVNKSLVMQLKNMPKEVRALPGCSTAAERLKNMGTVLPLVSALHSEWMEDRHWDQLKKLTGKIFDHKQA